MSRWRRMFCGDAAARVGPLCALGLAVLLTVALAMSQGGSGVTHGRCLICHVDLVEQLEAGRHGGEGAKLKCEACHGESEGHVQDEHNDIKPDRVFSSKTEEESAALVELCAGCHNDEAEDFRKAVTELKDREPPMPSCTGCHGSHRVARVRLPHALDDAAPQDP
jgi:hypothetical protein